MKTNLSTFLAFMMLAGMVVGSVRAQPATVEVSPASYAVPDVGLSFDINVTIRGVEDLYGFEFTLFYPNDILNGTRVTEGPFLQSGGTRTFFLVVSFVDNYNATQGRAWVTCSRLGNVTGMNGSGTLATITFKSTSTNTFKPLHLV